MFLYIIACFVLWGEFTQIFPHQGGLRRSHSQCSKIRFSNGCVSQFTESLLITGTNSTEDSKFLTRAELSISGSEVTIRCEFTDAYPEASCVLVYREYNDPYLTVEEYDRSTEFPVTISVDNPERYTFAVFGKSGTGGIDVNPVVVCWDPKGVCCCIFITLYTN